MSSAARLGPVIVKTQDPATAKARSCFSSSSGVDGRGEGEQEKKRERDDDEGEGKEGAKAVLITA